MMQLANQEASLLILLWGLENTGLDPQSIFHTQSVQAKFANSLWGVHVQVVWPVKTRLHGCVPVLFTWLLALTGCLWNPCMHASTVHKAVCSGRLFVKLVCVLFLFAWLLAHGKLLVKPTHVHRHLTVGSGRLFVKCIHCSPGPVSPAAWCMWKAVCQSYSCVPTLFTWQAVCQSYACVLTLFTWQAVCQSYVCVTTLFTLALGDCFSNLRICADTVMCTVHFGPGRLFFKPLHLCWHYYVFT